MRHSGFEILKTQKMQQKEAAGFSDAAELVSKGFRKLRLGTTFTPEEIALQKAERLKQSGVKGSSLSKEERSNIDRDIKEQRSTGEKTIRAGVNTAAVGLPLGVLAAAGARSSPDIEKMNEGRPVEVALDKLDAKGNPLAPESNTGKYFAGTGLGLLAGALAGQALVKDRPQGPLTQMDTESEDEYEQRLQEESEGGMSPTQKRLGLALGGAGLGALATYAATRPKAQKA